MVMLSRSAVAVLVAAAAAFTASAEGVALADDAPSTDDYGPSQPDVSAHPKNTLTIDPASLAFGVVKVEYERAFSSWGSVYVAPSVLAFQSPLLSSPKNSGFTAAGADTGVRFFFTGRAPEGLWVGPQLGLAYVQGTANGEQASAVGYDCAAIVGGTVLVANVVDVSAGVGVAYENEQVSVGETNVGLSGLAPVARLALGVAF
jgi:hypothetical protein